MPHQLPTSYGFIRTSSNTIQFKLMSGPYKVEGAYSMTPEGNLSELQWISGDQTVFEQWVGKDDFIPVIGANVRRFARNFVDSKETLKLYS